MRKIQAKSGFQDYFLFGYNSGVVVNRMRGCAFAVVIGFRGLNDLYEYLAIAQIASDSNI